MASFPQGAYGSMPMFYPQPAYQYPAYPTSWPPAPLPMIPAGQPGMPPLDVNARGPQPMMMQQIPVALPHGYAAGPSQPQQDSNANEQEPDLEEARMTMLAQYYKNPYYGLKAQLARAKADKRLALSKAVDDKKALTRYKQYLVDAMRDYSKDRAALAKREKYWNKVAYKEGIDEATIQNEQRALAARKRQLLDTKDYLTQQRRTLREQMRSTNGATGKDLESDLSGSTSFVSSSSSSSSNSGSHHGKHHRGKRKEKGRNQKRRSSSRDPKDRRTKHSGRDRSSHTARASPPLFPAIAEQVTLPSHAPSVPLSSATLATLPKLSGATSLQRISEHLATQTQQQMIDHTLPQDPHHLHTITESIVKGPDIAAEPPKLKEPEPDHGSRIRRLSERATPQELPPHGIKSLPGTNHHQLIPEQAEAPVMQVKFPDKKSFILSLSQIGVDAPNAFTQVLRDSQHKLKPGRTLKVPIQGHTAPVFTIIHAYLSGTAILPLSASHRSLLSNNHSESEAYEILLRDARFYQLRSLQQAVEACIAGLGRTRSVETPRQLPSTALGPPAPPFVLLDSTRKGQSIDIRDLAHLSAARLSRRRLLKTLPRVRALISGAALNFGAKSSTGGSEGALLQYSLAIPSTPLSLAWQRLSLGQPSASEDDIYFLEGEIAPKDAAAIKLNVDYADQSSPVRRRSSGLDEVLLRLSSSAKPSWDQILMDSFRFLQIGSPPEPTSRSTTPIFGISAPPNHRQLVNIPIASLVIDFTAEKEKYRIDIREISTKTRALEALDGYHEIASPASR